MSICPLEMMPSTPIRFELKFHDPATSLTSSSMLFEESLNA
jgi:hypothetical protein